MRGERPGVSDDIEARRAALRARFPVWEPVTLSGFLTRSARKYGDRPFVITDERTASYAEIDAWATRLADGLAALGVRPGDRVGVLMANYLEFVPVKFAIARAGAVAIPFNYLYRQDELGYVLRQSRCGVLVTMTGFGGLDYPAMLDAIAPGWAAEGPTAGAPGPAPGRAARHRRDRRPGRACSTWPGWRRSAPATPAWPTRPRSPRTARATSCTPRVPPGCPRAWWSPTTRCCGPATPRP